jgi:hypothetical protein
MKKIMILSALLLLLFGCDNSPKLNTEVSTASVEGNLELIGASVDTVDVLIRITHLEDSSLEWQIGPDLTGYFYIADIVPGYYNTTVKIDSRHYSDYSTQFTAFKDNKTSLANISLTRIENNAGIIGQVCFVNQANIEPVDIHIYYLDKSGNYSLDRSIQPDSMNTYQVENLFPGQHKLEFITNSYPVSFLFPTLLAGQTIPLSTVLFQDVTLIPFVTIQVDGTMNDWGDSIYENEHTSGWGPSNDFQKLYLAYDNDNLYVGIYGGFSATDNTVNVYFDTDAGATGVYDFSTISGGDIGNNLRKNFTCPESFGANFAFSGWALQYNVSVVSLENPQAVDTAQLTAEIVMTSQFIEFSIPLSEIYEDGIIPDHRELSLVAVIGGGGDQYLSDDCIPQQENVAQFQSVFTANFSQTGRK